MIAHVARRSGVFRPQGKVRTRDDARASDDVGWYAVRAVENAIAKRLADELFDEVLADTVMAMAGVR